MEEWSTIKRRDEFRFSVSLILIEDSLLAEDG